MTIKQSDSVEASLINDFIDGLNPHKLEYSLAHNPVIPIVLHDIFGYKPVYRMYYDEGRLIGYQGGVEFEGKYISMPHFSYGGIASNDVNFAIQNECSGIGNYFVRSFHPSGKNQSEAKVTSYIDLRGGEVSIFPKLKYNIRRQIRIATEKGVVVRFGKEELLDDFLTVYRKNMSRLGSPPQPHDFFYKLLTEWRNGEAVLCCSYYDDKVVGGSFMLSYGKIIENCWAGTLYEYNKIYVPYLVYSELIKYAISKGYEIFSFGRSSKESGTLAFKKHWNPVFHQIYYNQSADKKNRVIKKDLIINIYKKIVPECLNNVIGKVVTKYVY